MEIVIKNDPVIAKAHREYQKFSSDERLREIYQGQIEFKRRYESDVEEAQSLKTLEIAQKMFEEGIDIKVIEKVTGLSEQEIDKLKKG